MDNLRRSSESQEACEQYKKDMMNLAMLTYSMGSRQVQDSIAVCVNLLQVLELPFFAHIEINPAYIDTLRSVPTAILESRLVEMSVGELAETHTELTNSSIQSLIDERGGQLLNRLEPYRKAFVGGIPKERLMLHPTELAPLDSARKGFQRARRLALLSRLEKAYPHRDDFLSLYEHTLQKIGQACLQEDVKNNYDIVLDYGVSYSFKALLYSLQKRQQVQILSSGFEYNGMFDDDFRNLHVSFNPAEPQDFVTDVKNTIGLYLNNQLGLTSSHKEKLVIVLNLHSRYGHRLPVEDINNLLEDPQVISKGQRERIVLVVDAAQSFGVEPTMLHKGFAPDVFLANIHKHIGASQTGSIMFVSKHLSKQLPELSSMGGTFSELTLSEINASITDVFIDDKYEWFERQRRNAQLLEKMLNEISGLEVHRNSAETNIILCNLSTLFGEGMLAYHKRFRTFLQYVKQQNIECTVSLPSDQKVEEYALLLKYLQAMITSKKSKLRSLHKQPRAYEISVEAQMKRIDDVLTIHRNLLSANTKENALLMPSRGQYMIEQLLSSEFRLVLLQPLGLDTEEISHFSKHLSVSDVRPIDLHNDRVALLNAFALRIGFLHEGMSSKEMLHQKLFPLYDQMNVQVTDSVLRSNEKNRRALVQYVLEHLVDEIESMFYSHYAIRFSSYPEASFDDIAETILRLHRGIHIS